jgi:hypothetical protein
MPRRALRALVRPATTGALVLALAVPVVLATPVVHAQSAADKATARQLAIDGIKAYEAADYTTALDRLQRAQALYDAPVHLLYIARSQVKLGMLIEGSETYRRLARVELDATAPKAFVDAKESGAEELPGLEPRIPKLTVNIEPAGIADLELTIGQESVPAATVGVERPINPGRHVVTARAPGYASAQSTVELREGQETSVTLELEPGDEPLDTTAVAGADGQPGAADPGSSEKQEPGALGFVVGLRLGGLLASGDAATNTAGEGLAFDDYAKSGGGGELRGGIRFLGNFTAGLFFERYALLPGATMDASLDNFTTDQPDVLDSTAALQSIGLFATAGTKPGGIGGFGEVGVAIVQQLLLTRNIAGLDRAPECSATETLSGPALRVGGGGVLPLNKYVQLTATLNVSFGSFGSYDAEDDCGTGLMPAERVLFDISQTDSGAPHQLIFLGLGADFLFGSDLPSE